MGAPGVRLLLGLGIGCVIVAPDRPLRIEADMLVRLLSKKMFDTLFELWVGLMGLVVELKVLLVFNEDEDCEGATCEEVAVGRLLAL